MILKLYKEEQYYSNLLEKTGTVIIAVTRKQPIKISVKFEDEHYDISYDVPWSVAKMIYNKAVIAAEALVLESRCVAADGHLWLISGNLNSIISVSCRTGKHFCEGKQFVISSKRSDAEIKQMISRAIEEEIPF